MISIVIAGLAMALSAVGVAATTILLRQRRRSQEIHTAGLRELDRQIQALKEEIELARLQKRRMGRLPSRVDALEISVSVLKARLHAAGLMPYDSES